MTRLRTRITLTFALATLIAAATSCRLPGLQPTDRASKLKEASEERSRSAVRKESERLLAEVEAYLAKNSAAKDREEAYEILTEVATELEDVPRVLRYVEAYEKEFPAGEKAEAMFDHGTSAAFERPELLETAVVRIGLYGRRPGADPQKALVFRCMLAKAYEKFDRPADAIRTLDGLLSNEAIRESSGAVEELTEMRKRLSELGRPFHDFRATDLEGHLVDTATLRGKVVLIDFWASWCGPCRSSIPDLVRLSREGAARGLVIVGVNLDTNREDLPAFLAEQGITWAQVPDERTGADSISDEHGITGIPETLLLDRKGVLRRRGLGGKDLAAAVMKLLAS